MNKRFKILIVEDNDTNIDILSFTLKKNDYELIIAYDAESGIELAMGILPDLILMDIMLPGINGIEACIILKEKNLTKDIPIIFLSALNDPKTIVEGLKSGGVDFVSKPFNSAEILARIKTHLRIRTLEKERENLLWYIQKDMLLARDTQLSIISLDFPKSEKYAINSYYKPIDKVGGDFISYNVPNSDCIDILFGDVSGHGTSSAMISAMTILAFKNASNKDLSPDLALKYIHEQLNNIVKSHFISAIYLRFFPDLKKIEYSYAGHHPVLLIEKDKLVKLEGKGTAINIKSYVNTHFYVHTLKKTNKLLLFSDGLFEVFNETDEILGEENFINFAYENKHLNGLEYLDQLVNFSNNFCNFQQKDDMAMLLIEL